MAIWADRSQNIFLTSDQFTIDDGLFLSEGMAARLDGISRVTVQKPPRPGFEWSFAFAALTVLAFLLPQSGFALPSLAIVSDLLSLMPWALLAVTALVLIMQLAQLFARRPCLYLELHSGTRIVLKKPAPAANLLKALAALQETMTGKPSEPYAFSLSKGNVIIPQPESPAEAPAPAPAETSAPPPAAEPAEKPAAKQGQMSWSALKKECTDLAPLIKDAGAPEELVSAFPLIQAAINEKSPLKLAAAIKELGKPSVAHLREKGADGLMELIIKSWSL